MLCPLLTHIVALAASAGAGLGAGTPEPPLRGAERVSEHTRSPRAIASVSAGATVLEGARVRFPRLSRSQESEPMLIAADEAPAAARSAYVDRARGIVVISLDFI